MAQHSSGPKRFVVLCWLHQPRSYMGGKMYVSILDVRNVWFICGWLAGWLGLLHFGQSKGLNGWIGVVCIFVRGLQAEFYDIAARESKHLDGRIGVVCRKCTKCMSRVFSDL